VEAGDIVYIDDTSPKASIPHRFRHSPSAGDPAANSWVTGRPWSPSAAENDAEHAATENEMLQEVHRCVRKLVQNDPGTTEVAVSSPVNKAAARRLVEALRLNDHVQSMTISCEDHESEKILVGAVRDRLVVYDKQLHYSIGDVGNDDEGGVKFSPSTELLGKIATSKAATLADSGEELSSDPSLPFVDEDDLKEETADAEDAVEAAPLFSIPAAGKVRKKEPQPPGPPGTPTVVKCGDDWLELEWTGAEDHGFKLRGYTLRVVMDDALDIPTRGDGIAIMIRRNVLSCKVQNLDVSRRYAFAVQATNEGGTSPLSGFNGFAPFWSDKLAAPRLAAYGPRSLVLYYSPCGGENNPVKDYNLEYRLPSEKQWIREQEWSLEVMEAVLLDLPPDTTYEVKITCRHTLGGTQTSQASFSTCSPWPPSTPSPPRLIAAGAKDLEFEWDPPQDNGSPVTGYTLRLQRVGGKLNNPALDHILTTSYKVEKLRPNASYAVTLTAENAVGVSDLSEVTTYDTEGA